jgi:hypothetical protein
MGGLHNSFGELVEHLAAPAGGTSRAGADRIVFPGPPPRARDTRQPFFAV